MRKQEVEMKKLLSTILGNPDRPDKGILLLNKNFGRWFDIDVFKKILADNNLMKLLRYKKIIKEISDRVYDEVVIQFEDELIVLEEVKGLDEIRDREINSARDKNVKELIKAIF